jgi:hypothetical protein
LLATETRAFDKHGNRRYPDPDYHFLNLAINLLSNTFKKRLSGK